jgi:hypothetical protein
MCRVVPSLRMSGVVPLLPFSTLVLDVHMLILRQGELCTGRFFILVPVTALHDAILDRNVKKII